jgi:hypothetical protein
MGIEFRLFSGIDAFSKISGTTFSCSPASSLSFAKQPLDSAAVASGRYRMPRDGRCLSSSPALSGNPRFAPGIPRICVPANTLIAEFQPQATDRRKAQPPAAFGKLDA